VRRDTLVGCLSALAAMLLGSGGGCLIANYVSGGRDELAPRSYPIKGAVFGLYIWALAQLLSRARQSRWAFYGSVFLLLLLAFWVMMMQSFT
jgi:hypothetical protein